MDIGILLLVKNNNIYKIFNNYIFCIIVHMVLRSDHFLMEILISIALSDFDIDPKNNDEYYIDILKNLDCEILFNKFEVFIKQINHSSCLNVKLKINQLLNNRREYISKINKLQFIDLND